MNVNFENSFVEILFTQSAQREHQVGKSLCFLLLKYLNVTLINGTDYILHIKTCRPVAVTFMAVVSCSDTQYFNYICCNRKHSPED
jgi:hypothetical protein